MPPWDATPDKHEALMFADVAVRCLAGLRLSSTQMAGLPGEADSKRKDAVDSMLLPRTWRPPSTGKLLFVRSDSLTIYGLHVYNNSAEPRTERRTMPNWVHIVEN